MLKFGVISVSYVGEINNWQGGLTWPQLMDKYLHEWTPERLDKRLGRIKSLGFEFVELYKGDAGFETWGEDSPSKIMQLFARHGLKLASYCPGGVTSNEDFEHHFAFADKLGATMLSGTVGREPELVDRLADACKRWNKKYAIEPHGKTTTLCDPLEILAAINRYPQQLGACPDHGWFSGQGFDAVRAQEILRDVTLHTHLKDHNTQTKRACAPGDGDIGMDKIIRILRDAGYDGVWSIEWEAPYDPSNDLARAKEFVSRILAE